MWDSLSGAGLWHPVMMPSCGEALTCPSVGLRGLSVTCMLFDPCVVLVAALTGEADLGELTHIVITHVGPNRIPTLVVVLREVLKKRSRGTISLVVTNPALKVLQNGMKGERQGPKGQCWREGKGGW